MADTVPQNPVIQKILSDLGLTGERPPQDPQTWHDFLEAIDSFAETETEDTLILDETFDRMISNAVDAFILHDTSGHIREVNQAARDMLGYEVGEMIGEHVSIFETELDPGAFWDDMDTNEVFTVEGRHERKDGSTYPVEARVGAFEVSGEKVILALCRDITERKQRERELEALNETLAEARDRAERADRAKSEFLTNMSHELRTPLTAIIGYAEMLMEDMDDGRELQRDDLNRIRDAGEHMLSLLNTVLNLSKVEAGHVDLEPETFELDRFLDELRATVEPLAAENNNTFEMHITGLERMHTDKLKLRQILLNLLGNACKFTENGTIQLSVRGKAKGERAIFEVQDNGIGMNDEQLEEVFEAFRQAKQESPTEQTGTGLGLPLTRQYAQLLGGDINAESAPGEGSTFTVDLPVEVHV